MKKIIELLVICIFTCFSFFYTEKIIDLSKSNDPIMKKIEAARLEEELAPVNGILSEETMKVGKSGLEIDKDISYEKMKKLNKYDPGLLEYVFVKPEITKESNFEKQIIGSITNEKELSIIIKFDDLSRFDEIVYIFKTNDVPVTFFVDGKMFEDNLLKFKQNFSRNISFGFIGYDNIYNETSLRYTKELIKEHVNYSNYCLYENSKFLNSCKNLRISTIKPVMVEKNLYNFMKDNKENGLIYQVAVNGSNIRELNATLKYLKQKGNIIMTLEQLLKE